MLNDRLVEIALLRNSGLLDPDYLAKSIGLESSEVGGVPLEFLYLDNEKYWRAATSPLFDGSYYIDMNADLQATSINPLLHFICHGYKEGRSPSFLVDMDHILEQLNNEASEQVTAESKYHVLARYKGLRELLLSTDVDPCAFFENRVFRTANSTVEMGSADIPVEHYIRANGRAEGAYLECTSLASLTYYMSSNMDLETANVVPLLHLMQYGLTEGRRFTAEDRVSAAFLSNSAHLFGDNSLKSLKGFLAKTKGTGQIAGPAWPTPFIRKPLPALQHEAVAARKHAYVGTVLYHNSDDELRRLEASIRNEVRWAKGYDIQWAYFVNDPENEARYREIVGDRIFKAEDARNIGFGRGHNALMAECFRSDRLYIGANPDGYFTPGCIKALVDFSDFHNDQALIEAVAAPIDHPKWHDPVTLDTRWVSGACFALPRKLWSETAGFDERIHMYCEDVDLSWRVKLIGGLLKVCPTARFMHDVTPRFCNKMDEATEKRRRLAMLSGGYYLAKKWGNPDHARRLQAQLEGILGRGNLSHIEEPISTFDGEVAREISDFSLERFAPSRFWQ